MQQSNFCSSIRTCLYEKQHKSSTIDRKAEMDARKTQAALDRSERLATKEFKDEYLRLAKIHKTYYK